MMNSEWMDALVKESCAPGLTLKRVPVPEPGYGEVLIKIHKTAICGTDLHIYNWDAWSQQTLTPPLTIGHEYVGEIAKLGPYVKGLTIGQRVSGEGHIVCGHCRNCRAGNGQWCAHTQGVGVQRDGAFAQYLCLPASNVVPLDPTLPEDVVAFFDAYGNATHTALMFDVAGEDVLVTGAGPIGIMAGAICRRNGARQVVITDVNEYRLDLARRMGLFAVNVKTDVLEDVMRTHAMVEGFDVGLEMSGSPSAFTQMLDHMRNGGKIAMLGIFGKPLEQFAANEIIFKGLTVQGVYGRRMYETWYKMSAMVQGGLDLSPIITHRFSYRDFEKGFAAMNSGNSGKVILDWRPQE